MKRLFVYRAQRGLQIVCSVAACALAVEGSALAQQPLMARLPPEVVVAPPVEPTLTLEELEARALRSNPSIARAQALASAAQGNWLQVGLPPNPKVGYAGQQIGSGGLAEQDGVLVEQEFVRGGKLALNRQVAAQDIVRAQQQLAAQQQRVITDVRIAYYRVLAAQQQTSTSEELVAIAERSAQAARALFDAKEVSRADVLQADLEIENAQITHTNARNRLASGWRQLAAVTGDSQLAQQPVSGELARRRECINWQKCLERLLSSSPEVAAAATNVEQARWRLQRAIVEPRPNVTVQGLYNWRDNGIGGDSDGGLQVMFPLPAWDRNQGAIAEAQCAVVAAERALEQLELSLQQRLAPVFERYHNSYNQVERYEKRILPVAQESLDLTRTMYAAGETGYLTLLTAQRTFSHTLLSYIEALRELREAEAEIDGLLLSGSLEVRD